MSSNDKHLEPEAPNGETMFYNKNEGWAYVLHFNGQLNASSTSILPYSVGLVARYQALALERSNVYVFECNRMSP